jgi:hypothetical protein
MKKPNLILFLILSLITITKSTFGQTLNKVQREYFILGTLCDYMGREIEPREAYLLDRYDATQGPLVKAVDSILKIDYPVSDYKVENYTDKAGNALSFKIFSKMLSDKFNGYYDFKPSGSSTSDNDPLLNNRPIMTGVLKKNIFSNDNDKLAFLAGVYVRYGIVNDTSYEISIGNGPYKASVCYKLLKDMNCNPSYEILKDNIPVGHLLYFHPTLQVKSYLQKFMPLRNKLNNNLIAFFKKAESDSQQRSKEKH